MQILNTFGLNNMAVFAGTITKLQMLWQNVGRWLFGEELVTFVL